jgi:DNA-binding response OmpR family regulator
MRHIRRGLLDLRNADDFLWLLRWLKNAKHCDPIIYEELTRPTSMRKKIEALNAGARYVTPHQKMSRAAERRRRAAQRQGPNAASDTSRA